jgi:acetoin utilization deacetylase AcuC-like enzyme
LETHSEEYVYAVKNGEPSSLACSQGFSWCPRLYRAVLSSNGGVVAAVKAALEDGIAGSLSSGLHHARRSVGLGFCTFNGLAIAAKEAIKAGCEDVLILDLDAHGGGGTASLISSNVRIRHLDVVVDAFDTHADSVDMVGRSPLEYLTFLGKALEGLKPSLCIYNAGMDVHEHDCGPAGFDAHHIAARESIVFEWATANNVPIAFVMAGGYISPRRSLPELVAHHRMTLRVAAHFANAKVTA